MNQGVFEIRPAAFNSDNRAVRRRVSRAFVWFPSACQSCPGSFLGGTAAVAAIRMTADQRRRSSTPSTLAWVSQSARYDGSEEPPGSRFVASKSWPPGKPYSADRPLDDGVLRARRAPLRFPLGMHFRVFPRPVSPRSTPPTRHASRTFTTRRVSGRRSAAPPPSGVVEPFRDEFNDAINASFYGAICSQSSKPEEQRGTCGISWSVPT